MTTNTQHNADKDAEKGGDTPVVDEQAKEYRSKKSEIFRALEMMKRSRRAKAGVIDDEEDKYGYRRLR